MIYCNGDKNVISVSWDKSIVVHDESEKTPKIWRVATNVHHGDISCVAFSRHLGLIATGSTDCVISVREYERLRPVSSLLGHKTATTALAFVDPLPLLVSADFGGNVAIWAVPEPSGRQHRHCNEVLTRFINMQSLESSAPVTCLDPLYEAGPEAAAAGGDDAPPPPGRFALYTGDEDGDVRAWDLSELLVVAEVRPCEPKADWDPRKKDKLDAKHTTVAMAKKALAPETPELLVRVDRPTVRQLRSWRAHGDSVRSLKVYSQPECIVTAGYDHMVVIWTRDGQRMSVLRAYGSQWKFNVTADNVGCDVETLNDVAKQIDHEERKEIKKKLTNTNVQKAKSRQTLPAFKLHEEVEARRKQYR